METAAAVAWLAATASAGAPFSYVVTPNADHRVRPEREPDLWPLNRSAGLMLNDSPILARLAGFDGMVLPASPGADVVAGLFENVIRADVPVVIIGGVDEDIAALRARYGLTDIRWHQPPSSLQTRRGSTS
jgi:hypothetical protein